MFLHERLGSDSSVYNYTYTAAANSWTLDYPGGLREDVRTVSVATNGSTVYLGDIGPGISGYTRTETFETRVPGGADQWKLKRVYEQTDWGIRLVEETLSPDTNPQTTRYTYYQDTFFARQGGLLYQTIRPDGSWQTFTYDNLGRYSQVYSSFGDVPPDDPNVSGDAHVTQYAYGDAASSEVDGSGDYGTNQPDMPRYVAEYQQNVLVSARYSAFPSPGLRIDAQGTADLNYGYAGWSDPSNLFTTNRYYTTGVNSNRLQSIVRPDGTLQTFNYATDPTGYYRTNMTATGQPNSTFTSVVAGTTNYTVLNIGGFTILSVTRDIGTGVTLAQDTYSNFDNYGRPQRVTHLDGTHEDTYYSCCGIDSTIDRDGVPTQDLVRLHEAPDGDDSSRDHYDERP